MNPFTVNAFRVNPFATNPLRVNLIKVNSLRVNPPVQGRGGFRPPREWLNGMRKAPRGSRNSIRDAKTAPRNFVSGFWSPVDSTVRRGPSIALRVTSRIKNASPVRDDLCYPNLAVSECAFCAFFSAFAGLANV